MSSSTASTTVGAPSLTAAERANQFQEAFAAVTADEDVKKRFLTEYGLFERLFKLLRANQAGIDVAEDEEFFRKIAGAVVKIAPPAGSASPETEQAVKQFVSEGLAAGDIVDVLRAGRRRSA